jgi:hypothetical protein
MVRTYRVRLSDLLGSVHNVDSPAVDLSLWLDNDNGKDILSNHLSALNLFTESLSGSGSSLARSSDMIPLREPQPTL